MRPLLYMRYLAVPARTTPLLLIFCFALGLHLALMAGLFGLWLGIILFSWFFKYAYVLLDEIARGRTEPPVLSIEMVNPANEQRPLGQLVLIGAVYFAGRVLGDRIGMPVAYVVWGTGLLLLPASVAVFAVNGSLLDAINPVLLARFVRRVGLDYLALLVLPAGAGLLVAFLPALAVSRTLQLAVAMFAVLAAFSLIGGVLYEKREELELETWNSPEQKEARRAAEEDRADDRALEPAYALWRSGAHPRAWEEIEKALAERQHSLDAYRRFYAHLATWPDPRLAGRLAKDFIARLLAEKCASEALEVTRERLRADASFRPATGAQLVSLVRLARAAGDRFVARTLLEDFARHFPGDPAAPVVAQLQEPR